MDNTELFLDKYKELENAAINEFKLPPDGSAVAKLEKRSEFKDIRFELNYCREVRNLLQHNQRLDEEFAVQPGKKMIELLDMVLDRIKNPVRCMDIAVPFNDLVWRSLDDPVMPVIRIMNDRNISHVPILKDKRVYFTVILRMFIIPVICTMVMYLIHARGMVAVSFLICWVIQTATSMRKLGFEICRNISNWRNTHQNASDLSHMTKRYPILKNTMKKAGEIMNVSD